MSKLLEDKARIPVTLGVNARKILFNKSSDWEYEAEERVIYWHNGLGIHKYDQENTLRCVIAGMRIDPEHYRHLENAVNELSHKPGLAGVKLHKAKLSDTVYGINIPGFESAWLM